MPTTTTSPVTDALRAALWQLAANEGAGDTYARAAATGLLLAWVECHELAFHPHDPGHISVDYGAPSELVELLDSHPDLQFAWRRQMAAEQLATLIATGLQNDRAKATNGLTAIASAIGEQQSHHDNSPLVDADHLAGLALIAVGED